MKNASSQEEKLLAQQELMAAQREMESACLVELGLPLWSKCHSSASSCSSTHPAVADSSFLWHCSWQLLALIWLSLRFLLYPKLCLFMELKMKPKGKHAQSITDESGLWSVKSSHWSLQPEWLLASSRRWSNYPTICHQLLDLSKSSQNGVAEEYKNNFKATKVTAWKDVTPTATTQIQHKLKTTAMQWKTTQ